MMTTSADLFKRVRKLEIKTRGLSSHIFAGQYHSVFKGMGISFSEVREYHYGDDVRAIDWNVTARLGHPYVKVFEEERELTVMLLVDISGSSAFGTVNQMKRDMMTEICAVLSFSAISNNDKVGLILFTDRIEMFIPPKKGRTHILRIIRELIDFQPMGKGTRISEALRYFNNVIRKRSIAFLLSDFNNTGYHDALRIAGRKHDLIGVRIYDSREESIPPVGLVRAVDAETGSEFWLDTSSRKVRDHYSRFYRDSLSYFNESFLRSRSDQLSIRTDQPYVNALIRFFRKREKVR